MSSTLTRLKSPSHHSGDAIPDFRYPVLRNTKTGIRLAHVQPGSGTRAIAIDLVEDYVTGSDRTPYDALSYTWGDGARDKNIFCNGKRLPVTKTLLEALYRFRRPDKVVTLWVDWICVCQERIRERNSQVEMMGDIYKAARKVIVWLGDDYNDSRAGMQLATQLLHIAIYQPVSGLAPADLETHGLPKRGYRRWKALSSILQRPWFWRTWVVQEVAANPNVELFLGSLSFMWDELELIVSLLEGKLPQAWHLDQAATALELPFSRINRIRLRHLKGMTTTNQPHIEQAVYPESADMSNLEGEPDLLDLLFMSRHLGATDSRDKIYALLGLAKHDISPDYSMSPYSIYTDFALQMIGLVTSEADHRIATLGLDMTANDPQVRRAMIMLSCAGRHHQKLSHSHKLASWVPDWSVDLQARPLIFGVERRFSAGGTRLGLFDWHPDYGLQLCGKVIDTVHEVGRVKLDHVDPEFTSGSHAAIAEWWLEAQTIALARVVRSPGSSMNVDAFDGMRRDLLLCRHGYFAGGDQQPNHHSSLLNGAEALEPEHSATRTLVLGPTRGRVVFVSATGWVGLAPYGSREGDVVFVAVGADVPYILRTREDGFELIGECYVQGLMDGEAMEMDWIGVQDVMIR